MMLAMLKNFPPDAPVLHPLPVADDDIVAADLDLCLSTPSTVVVNARLEVEAPGAGGASSLELALVIPRSQCRGERPTLPALLQAAQAAVARATRAGTTPLLHLPRRVVTLVAGRPHLIPVF
jgi:hypothetical protein